MAPTTRPFWLPDRSNKRNPRHIETYSCGEAQRTPEHLSKTLRRL